MCDSRRPGAGADSEPTTPYDDSCDLCARQVGIENLRQVKVGRSISWQCGRCLAKQAAMYDAMTKDAA